MSEYASYVEQAAYEDGLEKGRQESRNHLEKLKITEQTFELVMEHMKNLVADYGNGSDEELRTLLEKYK